MRLTLWYATTRETKPDHKTGKLRVLLFWINGWASLTSPANHVTLKMRETGPTIYTVTFCIKTVSRVA